MLHLSGHDRGTAIGPLAPADSPTRLVPLALLAGVIAALGAVAFRGLIGLFHNLLFLGTFSPTYDANLHTPPGPWGAWVIAVPVIGAIVVAFLVKNFAPEAKGHGVPEVIEPIYYRGGAIRPAVALVKALASSISIGSGGAVGREGPIIQIGAAFGSALGGLIRVPEWQRITLIACGASGGIAATFNTPIGGLLFAGELLLPELSARTLIPVALATGTATFVGQLFFGTHPAFEIPALALSGSNLICPWDLPIYAGLGLILGGVSAVYIHSIYAFEDAFNRLPGNYYSRHLLGMLLVGVMMYVFLHHTGHYYVQGVGYATVQDVLSGVLLDPWFLLLLAAAKLLATSLTLGSGASGGIFSPSLFIGAALGAAYTTVVASLLPHIGIGPAGGAVIGMAGMVGGATGAVITAIVMVFEMTRNYDVIVPLMITVSIAYGMRRLLMGDSIYSLKLTRRGRYIPESLHTHGFLLRPVAELVSVPTVRIAPGGDLPPWPHGHYHMGYGIHGPHVLVADAERVYGVLSNDHIERLGLSGRIEAESRILTDTRYVVVSGEATLCDVVGHMRRARCDLALVIKGGHLGSPDDVVGILSWSDLVRHDKLPDGLLRHPDHP